MQHFLEGQKKNDPVADPVATLKIGPSTVLLTSLIALDGSSEHVKKDSLTSEFAIYQTLHFSNFSIRVPVRVILLLVIYVLTHVSNSREDLLLTSIVNAKRMGCDILYTASQISC